MSTRGLTTRRHRPPTRSLVYDVTEPTDGAFVTYLNNRDFTADPEDSTAGDLGPEGLAFIEGEDSPTGAPLVAVANEVSGTSTVVDVEHLPRGRG